MFDTHYKGKQKLHRTVSLFIFPKTLPKKRVNYNLENKCLIKIKHVICGNLLT